LGTKVFFNNSCNICRFEINHYKKNSGDAFDWIDITNNEEAVALTSKSQKDLLRRLHIIKEGKVIVGAEAFIVIWSSIDKYKILAKIFSFKLCFIIFHYSYEIVSYFLFLKNRNQLK
jgi:predicted DCC family thiol-disulfide oxidoreductase YuxK